MATESSLIKTQKNLKKMALVVGASLLLFFVVKGTIQMISEIGNDPVNNTKSHFQEEDRIFEDIELPIINPEIALAEGSDPIFSLTGELSNFAPESVYVYATKKNAINFSTKSRAESAADRLGFEEDSEISGTELSWLDQRGRLANFSTTSLNWLLLSNTNFLKELNQNTKEFDEEEVLNTSNQLLGVLGANPKDSESKFDTRSPEISNVEYLYRDQEVSIVETSSDSPYYLISYSKLVNSAAIKNTSSNEEYLEENNISKEFRLVTTDPKKSNFYTITSNKSRAIEDIVYIHFYPIELNTDKDNIGIYELINPNEAFQLLKNGEGSLRSITKDGIPQSSPTEEISEFVVNPEEVEPAYFAAEGELGYTYPIYIFSGIAVFEDGSEGEFIFYIDALRKKS